MNTIQTPVLDIAYEQMGPPSGKPIFFLHGWPDAPHGWNIVGDFFSSLRYKCIIPYLRGWTPTTFRDSATTRDGSAVALAQDTIDLADALGIEKFCVVGHDWGARTAYTLAALFPERVEAIAALSVAFQPGGQFNVPGFAQSKRFWYQWFMCVDKCVEAIKSDPIGFAHIQWETWGPKGWYEETAFTTTAESFKGPDWIRVTLNGYRSRWLTTEPTDPRYDTLRTKLALIKQLSVPTLMIQGGADYCDPAQESEGQEKYFTGEYNRIVLDRVGDFPHRELPDIVAGHIEKHFAQRFS